MVKTNSNYAVKVAERSNHSLPIYLINHFAQQTSILFNVPLTEHLLFDRTYFVNIRKVWRRKLLFQLILVLDWVKQFFSVSIVNINMMTRSFILDIRTLHVRSFFSLWFSKFFKIVLVVISLLLYLIVISFDQSVSDCFKLTAIYLLFNLFARPCKRQILYCLHLFKEILFSNFSWKLFNKYFSLHPRTCQFRVSVRK